MTRSKQYLFNHVYFLQICLLFRFGKFPNEGRFQCSNDRMLVINNIIFIPKYEDRIRYMECCTGHIDE